jgi:hypothetical protein
MAEFKISRIRYTWRNQWESSTNYIKDDIVSYGSSSWVCIRQHTASAFNDDQLYTIPGDTAAQPAWIKMTDGYAWRSEWTEAEIYEPGDIAAYGGTIYICVNSHTSQSTFDANLDDWGTYISAISWTKDWTQNTRYGVNDLAKYNGIVYRCTVGHTSASTPLGLEAGTNDAYQDSTFEAWEIAYEGIEFVGDWRVGLRLRDNDLVKFGGSILRCTVGHTAGSEIVPANFVTEFPGFNFYEKWTDTVYYAVGDVVKHGGYLYRSNTNNINKSPGDAIYDIYISNPSAIPDWFIISKGINYRGTWAASSAYRTGDVVRRGGYLYVALLDTTINDQSSTTFDDGSSLDYLDSTNWEIVVPGQNFRNFWVSETEYTIGDVVTYKGTAYQCNQAHASTFENFPGDNGSGYYFWDIVLQAGPNVALGARGDLLTYDLSRTAAGDGSTFGTASVPIGEVSQVLAINDEDSAYYKTWGNVQRSFYVRVDGVDDIIDPDRGINFFKPWRTIRFACEQANDGYAGTTTINVYPGVFEEVLPIIVPQGTVVNGQELRMVTVTPKAAIAALAGDSIYSIAALERISEIIVDVVQQIEVTPTPGNEELQQYPTELVPTSGEYIPVIGSEAAGISVQDLIVDIVDYINFYINSGDTEPNLYGTNSENTAYLSYGRSATVILANVDFLAAEAIAYVKLLSQQQPESYPVYNFDELACARDIREYAAAWAEDIVYTSNYKSLLAARYYRNAVLGSEGEDMFYVRNATGLRNMTLKGLVGTLNPPNVYDLYQKPNGGAYVSLDPGWGPDHEACWITTRSCYVQNVTTFGYGAIGQKIDGALHNGGNRSIVSNDFTQVISDGIGAWVLNGGRAELVSVFTYYAQVGYLAENGGIIRGTNGNCSYGFIGAQATGNDPNEIPQYATVNTRNQQAIVATAFAGEVNDEILALEFENCGQDYTTANYTFVGSGVNASVIQEEFRDDAVFDVHIINAPDSASPGGTDFTFFGNNAQNGTLTTLTIASNDENTEADILGMRIIITSGSGTGQYGYVGAFNELTKVVSVLRDSDDQPGWDHVTPGYPLVETITTSAVYRFEPRPIFSDPGFASSLVTMPSSVGWGGVAYGETYETYNNVTGSEPLGTVVPDDGLTVLNATWNVIKNGRSYIVSLNNPGAGYVDEQEIIIKGSFVGGIDIDNDIIIKVKSISDDSTDSILTFEYSGLASSGRFVSTAYFGNSAAYSKDGTTWTSTTMPASASWGTVAAGNNRFVAVVTGAGDTAAYSLTGKTWTAATMPFGLWKNVVYGGEVFFAVAEGQPAGTQPAENDCAFTLNGATWYSTTMPTAGDSTVNFWQDAAYGKGQFVVLSNSNNLVARGTYDSGTNTFTWGTSIMDVIADSSQKDWISIAYGNNRWVAISTQGDVGYSFDGQTWYPARMPSLDDSTPMAWVKIRYAQGVFFAVCTTGARTMAGDATAGPTDYAATSYDGVVWTERTLSKSASWTNVAFGNPDITSGDSEFLSNNKGTWISVASEPSTNANKVYTGCRTLGRVVIDGSSISQVKIWEPGSGYSVAPTLTVFDPTKTTDLYVNNRLGDGVLAQPTWINRGVGYKTSTTVVSILGDGFADVVPIGRYVTLSGLPRLPGPGAQFRFGGNETIYTVVVISPDYVDNDGLITAQFQISPYLKIADDLLHNTVTEIRERYSQVRITGHDFLDIGTGNFVETNYPEIYSTGIFTSAPENETVEANGGRVFYTSTDQSGNFRTGELFAVEQATGVVTISADFFDLNGLTELALGGVRLGGTGTVVREFSTDAKFTADSNNIVSTERAIKAYLANRLNVGGSDLLTASFIAGTSETTGSTAHVSGTMLASTMFYKAMR